MNWRCLLGFHSWVQLEADSGSVRGCRRCLGWQRYHDIWGWSECYVEDIRGIPAWDVDQIAWLRKRRQVVLIACREISG